MQNLLVEPPSVQFPGTYSAGVGMILCVAVGIPGAGGGRWFDSKTRPSRTCIDGENQGHNARVSVHGLQRGILVASLNFICIQTVHSQPCQPHTRLDNNEWWRTNRVWTCLALYTAFDAHGTRVWRMRL